MRSVLSQEFVPGIAVNKFTGQLFLFLLLLLATISQLTQLQRRIDRAVDVDIDADTGGRRGVRRDGEGGRERAHVCFINFSETP